MKGPDSDEKLRQAAVAETKGDNVWRGVKPKGIFAGALAQDNKDYPAYVDEYHTATMVNPDILNANR